MKPPAFTYHRPATLADALAVLAGTGPAGKVLAGGQSLVPMLNMRLAQPGHLVDINRVAGLGGIECRPGLVRVGALARHAELAADPAAAVALPLLAEATAAVAHPAIRNRGTTVGSLVHADPAAELPAVLALLGGSVTLAGPAGYRTVPADGFFLGPLQSATGPGEVAVHADFPVPPPGTGTAWLEVSRRRGDYALCGVGVLVTLDPAGRITAARAGFVALGPVPVVVDLAPAVAGAGAGAADWAAAGRLAAAHPDLAPEDDIHASAGYRRHLAGVLTARAGALAAVRAAERAAEWSTVEGVA